MASAEQVRGRRCVHSPPSRRLGSRPSEFLEPSRERPRAHRGRTHWSGTVLDSPGVAPIDVRTCSPASCTAMRSARIAAGVGRVQVQARRSHGCERQRWLPSGGPCVPMKPDAVAASSWAAIAAEVEPEHVGREPVQLGGPTLDRALAAGDRLGGARSARLGRARRPALSPEGKAGLAAAARVSSCAGWVTESSASRSGPLSEAAHASPVEDPAHGAADRARRRTGRRSRPRPAATDGPGGHLPRRSTAGGPRTAP